METSLIDLIDTNFVKSQDDYTRMLRKNTVLYFSNTQYKLLVVPLCLETPSYSFKM